MALMRRFEGKDRNSISQKLARLKQEGCVEDYMEDFEILVEQGTQASEEQMLRYFFVGQQRKIRNLIRPHNPKIL